MRVNLIILSVACVLWRCGVASVSQARAMGSSTAILFIFEKKLSLNLTNPVKNSVKTFRENSIVRVSVSQ